MSRIPKIYPDDGPLRWQGEESGVLPVAVLAFWNHFIDKTPMTSKQIELIRDYLEYYVNAPCFQLGPEGEAHYNKFMVVRERVRALQTAEEINVWIVDCLNVGIDPL